MGHYRLTHPQGLVLASARFLFQELFLIRVGQLCLHFRLEVSKDRIIVGCKDNGLRSLWYNQKCNKMVEEFSHNTTSHDRSCRSHQCNNSGTDICCLNFSSLQFFCIACQGQKLCLITAAQNYFLIHTDSSTQEPEPTDKDHLQLSRKTLGVYQTSSFLHKCSLGKP